MKKTLKAISFLITASILLSSMFTVAISAQSKEASGSSSYIINAEEISLQLAGNCTVSGNTATSNGNMYPAFNLILPGKYNIESIKITASTVGANYHIGTNGLQFYNGSTQVEAMGEWGDNYSTSSVTKTFSLTAENAGKNVDIVAFRGFWNGDYAAAGSAVITIEKIEIIGKQTAQLINLSKEDFNLSAVGFCTVEGNTVLSGSKEQNGGSNIYPQFNLRFKGVYSIEEFRISATVTGNCAMNSNTGGIQLTDNGKLVEGVGVWGNFFNPGVQTTLAFSVSSQNIGENIDGIDFRGAWTELPENAGDSKITIDKIQIIGKKTLDNIELLPNDFSLACSGNCSVSGNQVASMGGNKYPAFDIQLPGVYNIKSIKITASSQGANYHIDGNGLRFYDGTTQVEALGEWADNYSTTVTTKTFGLKAENTGKSIDAINFRGFWDGNYATDGAAVLTIEKIEIIGTQKENVIALSAQDFDLIAVSNCTVDGNIISSGSVQDNIYPQFDLNFKNDYSIKRLKITATVTGSNGMTSRIVTKCGSWDMSFLGSYDRRFAGQQSSIYFYPDSSDINYGIDGIDFRGEWIGAPANPGDAKITIEKIEILGSVKNEMIGDANGDGVVNIIDIVRTKKALVDTSVKCWFKAVDSDKDGQLQANDLASLKKLIIL